MVEKIENTWLTNSVVLGMKFFIFLIQYATTREVDGTS